MFKNGSVNTKNLECQPKIIAKITVKIGAKIAVKIAAKIALKIGAKIAAKIISSSQITMLVAFFTLQDSFFFFCSGMDCQIFIVRGIILVCHTRCLSFTE